MNKVIVLVDGEHYPAVTRDAIQEIGRAHKVLGAVFLGGTEKIGSESDLSALGVPVIHTRDYLAGIRQAIQQFRPQEVVDLSDEPVLGYKERFAIANVVLAHGAAYSGADFRFNPPAQHVTVRKPSISVIGTGKRIGKTAIGGYVARTLAREFRLIVVTMGRGGPAEPEVICGGEFELTPEYLLSVSKQGRHASSDHFEDALTSRVTTVGCRRCGGGMSGQTYTSNVDRGAAISDSIDGDIVVFEGSGSSIPSVQTDARILVAGAHQPVDYIASYLGPYRVTTSNLVVLTMCEAQMVEDSQVERMVTVISELNPQAKVVRTIFRPRPLGNIASKRVAVCLTAPKRVASLVSEYLIRTFGCEVVGLTCNLANRPLLRDDLARFAQLRPDTVMTELKAAAVDVVTAWGLENGFEVVYMDNEPIPVNPQDRLDQEILALARACISKHKGVA
ncbi:MAG: 2,3-diphosphoglycerate synthetase [Bacillota bacterium]